MAGEWLSYRIGDLGTVVTGRTPPGTHPDYFGDLVPFLTPTDMDGRRRVETTGRTLSQRGADLLKKAFVPHGVAVSCIGWQMGKALLVDRPVVTNQQVNSLIPDHNLADDLFLYYALTARRQEIFGLGAGGSRTPILNKSGFADISIDLPPPPEQRAIAHILGTLDDKIELNRRMNETLEAMARALFKSWFVDFDPVRAKAEGRNPGLPNPLADLFPASFEDSELGEIPKGWKVGTLGDVAEHPRRGVQPTEIEPSTPYIALEHMPKRCIALSEWGAADGLESNKFEFKRGEILFGKLRPYFHKVGVAPVDGVCSTDIVVVAPRESAWFGFVMGHVSSDAFVEHTNAGSTGTKMPRTSWAEMARYPVVIPRKTVCEVFTNKIRQASDRIVASIHESRTLAAVRDTLLPKLISGDLRVSDAKRFEEGTAP